MINKTVIGLALSLVAAAPAFAADLLPLDQLVRNPRISSGQISPTGEFLAITAPRGGDQDEQDVLIVMKTSDLSVIKVNQLPDGKSAAEATWVGPNRIMFSAVKKLGSFTRPFALGEWYAVNADGSKPATLIERGSRGATKEAISSAAIYDIRDPLVEDDRKVLMEVSYFGSTGGDSIAQLVEMDTFTGRMNKGVRAPDPSCGMALDPDAKPRYATCSRPLDGTRSAATLYRREGGEWTKIYDSEGQNERLLITHVMADGRAFAQRDDGNHPATLGWFSADGKFTEVWLHERVDPFETMYSIDGDTPIGVLAMAGYPEISIIDKQHPDVAVYKALAQSFEGGLVRFRNGTTDGNQLIFTVSSDRDPGSLYLFDRPSGKARFLLGVREWIDPAAMAEMRPITLTARDGVRLDGYLSIPAGKEPKNLPMIVNPHGGPYGPFDQWRFSEDVQILASRGYLVLQINYRGSGNYGEGFTEMGYRQWGGTMQDDVTDATHWAIEQGYADKDRICLYGASYGGYATLMGVAKEPDLYRCAAGYVGVYDLELMYDVGDIQFRDQGRDYLEKVLGRDPKELKQRSPAAQAEKIKVPVFLAAGKKDQRTPQKQTIAMYNALRAAGNPVRDEDYILQAGEGHGFYDEKNKLNFYTRLLNFLERNTQPRAPAAGSN